MILEIVLFRLPDGMNRADAMTNTALACLCGRPTQTLFIKPFCSMKRPGEAVEFISGRTSRLPRKRMALLLKRQSSRSSALNLSSSISKHPS